MAREQSYRDWIAWQEGRFLARDVYRLTAIWPPEERFGLVNQARRAASSIPANIAEGSGRTGRRELRHHLSLAHGSLCELESHLILGMDLGFMSSDDLDGILEQSAEVGRVVRGFLRKPQDEAS